MLLFLTENRSFGIRMVKCLQSMGIVALFAKPDAGESLCHLRDTGGILLDGRDDPDRAQRLCLSLLNAYPELPIALMLPREVLLEVSAARVLRGNFEDGRLAEELLAFYLECCGGKTEMSTFSLSVGASPDSFLYLGYPLTLPPRTQTLLRFLFHCAPRTVSAPELMAASFPEGTQKATSLTTLVGIVNKRARAISDLPLIESVRGKGYRLTDGIVKQ